MAESVNEIKVHEKGYTGFIQLMKWGAVAAFIVGLIVVLIISR